MYCILYCLLFGVILCVSPACLRCMFPAAGSDPVQWRRHLSTEALLGQRDDQFGFSMQGKDQCCSQPTQRRHWNSQGRNLWNITQYKQKMHHILYTDFGFAAGSFCCQKKKSRSLSLRNIFRTKKKSVWPLGLRWGFKKKLQETVTFLGQREGFCNFLTKLCKSHRDKLGPRRCWWAKYSLLVLKCTVKPTAISVASVQKSVPTEK